MSAFTCPHCGTEVPEKALCCPECGSDRETGWNQDSSVTGDPVVDEVDYDEAVEQEFGKPEKKRASWAWVIAAVLLIIFFIYLIKSAL
jgi:uncharacterized membrane protein YvbJ